MKEETRLETPAVFSTHSMVMGRVETDEEVENAVSSAGAMARKWSMGLILNIHRKRDMTRKN